MARGLRGLGERRGPGCRARVPSRPSLPSPGPAPFSWPSPEGPHGGGLAGSAEAGAWGQVPGASLLIGTWCWEESKPERPPRPIHELTEGEVRPFPNSPHGLLADWEMQI